jgi:hypothetical protein
VRPYVVVSALLLVGFVLNVCAQESDLLSLRIKATAVKDESIDEVLGDLAVDYQIPVGIELGDSKLTPRRKIEMDLPETTLKDFLDAVIAKDPRYTWKLERGVIHASPVTARDMFVESLLDTKISNFTMSDKTTRRWVFDDILNLPEIGSKLVIADVTPLTLTISWLGVVRRLKSDGFFSESNLTMRELLDKIVLKTEIKRWVILRWGDNNEYITLRS